MTKTTTPKNAWFRTVKMGGRKSCPSCKSKLNGEDIWTMGEYINGKWRTLDHFCKSCWSSGSAKSLLKSYTAQTGREVELQGKGERLPDWLTLEDATGLLPGVNPLSQHRVPDTKINRDQIWKAYDWLTIWKVWAEWQGQGVVEAMTLSDMTDFLSNEFGVWEEVAWEVAVAVLGNDE